MTGEKRLNLFSCVVVFNKTVKAKWCVQCFGFFFTGMRLHDIDNSIVQARSFLLLATTPGNTTMTVV